MMSEVNGTLSQRLIALLTEEVRLLEMKEQVDSQIMALRGAIQECRNIMMPVKTETEAKVEEVAEK